MSSRAERLSGLEYPIDKPPGIGKSVTIIPGVHWIRLPIPGSLHHINVWLLRDGPGWTLVDSGMALSPVREAWEELFAAVLDGMPIWRVIVTHHHPDHVGLAKWVGERFDAEIWMSEPEFESVLRALHSDPAQRSEVKRQFLTHHGYTDFEGAERFLSGAGYRKIISGAPAGIRALRDGECFTIGDHAWAIIMTGGHATGHAGLYCEELGLLISGDHILPRISSNISVTVDNGDGNPLREYLQSFARFRALPVEPTVLPSHGHVFRGLERRLRQLESEHVYTLGKVVAACKEPRSAGDLYPDIYSSNLDGLHRLLAFGETLAHLRYLEQRGRLHTETGDDGIARFVNSG